MCMQAFARSRPALRAPVVVLLGLVMVVAMAESAVATFAGERGRIAFVRVTDPSAEGSEQIFTVGQRGGPGRRLTFLSGGAPAPAHAPGGARAPLHPRG